MVPHKSTTALSSTDLKVRNTLHVSIMYSRTERVNNQHKDTVAFEQDYAPQDVDHQDQCLDPSEQTNVYGTENKNSKKISHVC